MAPLSIEVYHPEKDKWFTWKAPAGSSASFTNNKGDGTREIYRFEVGSDDSKTTFYRAVGNEDITLRGRRYYPQPKSDYFQIIKELKKGESFEMEVRTDKNLRNQEPARPTRYTHT